MASNETVAGASDIADPDLQKFLNEGLPYNSEHDRELQHAFKVSYEVDMTLAYSSEKLANLENLLLQVLSWEHDIKAIDLEDDNISAEFIEKAFTFDFLYAILISELTELDNLMADLQDLIVDSQNKISSSEHSVEMLTGLAEKLRHSEHVLKQSQERVLGIKIQLAKLQMASFVFKQNEYKRTWERSVKEELRLATTEWSPQKVAVERKRVLRMLEISLASEMELEKKLKEVKQNEEDLKSKIQLMEQVAVCMEEAAESAWGRFLEADNRAEILLGISREILGRSQTVGFNFNNASKREEELESKLQDCIKQLNEKETSIQTLNSSIKQLIADNSQVTTLRESVQALEEKLSKTESKLVEANASSERSREQVREMESDIDSLRENLYAAEDKVGNAEAKVTHLTDTNVELTEELDFVKVSNESNAKKVSLLEKQVRDLQILLQHSKAASEASQEQQNMLYSAIWDMETLIDELKQKVVKAEGKTEIAEEQCVLLSEANSDLNKELDFVRARMELVETSLDQATLQKRLKAKDINIRTGLIMDMVMQLAMERERIEKQLTSLTTENKLLREKLHKKQNSVPLILQYSKSQDDEEVLLSELDSAEADCAKISSAIATSEIVQVDESPTDSSLNQDETGSLSSSNHNPDLDAKPKVESLKEKRKSRKMYMFMATLVLLASVVAAHLFYKELAFLRPVESFFTAQ